MSKSGRSEREFELLYTREHEPWEYSERAAEVLRHDWVSARVAECKPARVLDVGCSVGQLTRRLAALPIELVAIDVAETAIMGARARNGSAHASFVCGSVTMLPFPSRSFDVVVASDGPFSWDLSEGNRACALTEIARVVRPGGMVVFTEHTRRRRFGEFVEGIERSGLRATGISYLYDRPWYQFESWLKALRDWRVARWLRRNRGIARALQGVGRRIGPSASRHICVLARRPI